MQSLLSTLRKQLERQQHFTAENIPLMQHRQRVFRFDSAKTAQCAAEILEGAITLAEPQCKGKTDMRVEDDCLHVELPYLVPPVVLHSVLEALQMQFTEVARKGMPPADTDFAILELNAHSCDTMKQIISALVKYHTGEESQLKLLPKGMRTEHRDINVPVLLIPQKEFRALLAGEKNTAIRWPRLTQANYHRDLGVGL